MTTQCPECRSKSSTAGPYCDVCFYRFSPADLERFVSETRKTAYRLVAIATGLGVAVLCYALKG
jgi:hypothetical protein